MNDGERLRHSWRSLSWLTRLRIVWILVSYHYGDYICAGMIALSVAIYIHARTFYLLTWFQSFVMVMFGVAITLSLNLYRIRSSHYKPLVSSIHTVVAMLVGAIIQDELLVEGVRPLFATLIAMFAAGYVSFLTTIAAMILFSGRLRGVITD